MCRKIVTIVDFVLLHSFFLLDQCANYMYEKMQIHTLSTFNAVYQARTPLWWLGSHLYLIHLESERNVHCYSGEGGGTESSECTHAFSTSVNIFGKTEATNN